MTQQAKEAGRSDHIHGLSRRCRKYLNGPITELAAAAWFAAPSSGEIHFDAGEGGFRAL
jgi:hypothetical protein